MNSPAHSEDYQPAMDKHTLFIGIELINHIATPDPKVLYARPKTCM